MNRKSKNTVFALVLCKNNFSESLVKRNILQNIANSIILDPNLNLWKLKSYLTAFCLFFGFLQLYCHLYFLGNIWTEKKIQAPPQLGHTGPNHKHSKKNIDDTKKHKIRVLGILSSKLVFIVELSLRKDFFFAIKFLKIFQ